MPQSIQLTQQPKLEELSKEKMNSCLSKCRKKQRKRNNLNRNKRANLVKKLLKHTGRRKQKLLREYLAVTLFTLQTYCKASQSLASRTRESVGPKLRQCVNVLQISTIDITQCRPNASFNRWLSLVLTVFCSQLMEGYSVGVARQRASVEKW